MGLRDAARALREGDPMEAFREELAGERNTAHHLQENLWRLEMAMEDEGWRRLGADLQREFTRSGLDDTMRASRAMYLSNPLISRAVNVVTYYTWAQGVTFKAADDKIQREVIEPQMDDDGNRAELYVHQARILTDVDQLCDGNVFMAMFTNDLGEVALRSIPAEEIRDIHTAPNDRGQIWFYRRTWTEQVFNPSTGETDRNQKEALYPDWRYSPVQQPESIGGTDVKWNAPVIHQRTGGLKGMRFGLPETFAALDWARAYKRFLEDWHSMVSSLARFAWRRTTSKSKLKAEADKFGEIPPDDELESFPRRRKGPPAGSVFVDNDDEGADMTPIPKTGATTSADDAKASRLMVGSAMNLPDTILSGDPQQGNLATAKTLDRPTELSIASRQAMWADFHKDIFRYAVDARIRRGKLPGTIITTDDGLTRVKAADDVAVDVSFPPILEHDARETVGSIVAAATLEGKTDAGTIPREVLSRKLMETIDVDDIEQAISDLDAEQKARLAQAVDSLKQAMAPAAPQNGGGPQPQPEQEPQP